MSVLFVLSWFVAGLAFFVCLIILIVKMAKGKSTTKILIATLVCLAVSIGSIALGAANSCDHEYEVISQTEPTCTVDGEIVSVCSLCGNETIEVLVATGHTMVLMSETEPTVQANGEIVYACSVCGTEYVEEIDNSEVVAAYEAEQAAIAEAVAVAEAEKAEEERLNTDYADIYTEYQANELRADEAYQGNVYRITASIRSINSENWSGGVTLTLRTTVKGDTVSLWASFADGQSEQLKLLNSGDIITFEGQCSSESMWKECVLVEVN